MPTRRWGLGTCVVDGKIYAIGGRSGSDVCAANEVYDPVIDTWTIKSFLQQKRNGSFVCSIGDKIYSISGVYLDPQDVFISTVEEYDTGLSAPSPDFNFDGIVDTNDLLIIIESWGQDNPLCDITPQPFGDGIVDVLDLEFFMDHWGKPVEDSSLIAHWALDEVEGEIAYDNANVNDASVFGEPTWQPDGGKVGGALSLDGIDDYIFAQNGLNPSGGPFSVFVWIQGGLPGQVVISQLNGANWLYTDSKKGNLVTGLKALDRSGISLMSQVNITDGNWHRVGFVWDGQYRALYIDDILVAEDTQKGLESSVGGLNIGCGSNSANGTFWSGLIDDVRIYNVALSTEEIAALAQ